MNMVKMDEGRGQQYCLKLRADEPDQSGPTDCNPLFIYVILSDPSDCTLEVFHGQGRARDQSSSRRGHAREDAQR